MNAPGMLSDSTRKAILHYIKTLRTLAREDKRHAYTASFPKQRIRWMQERNRRLREAWRLRKMERDYRPETLRAQLQSVVRSQLRESLFLEAAE